MKGLRNLGTTCYLNVAMQCLLYTPQLVNYFLSGLYNQDLLKKRQNASALCEEFASLVHTYWRSEDNLNLDRFIAAFLKCNRSFVLDQQHDAHEVFNMILTILHESLSKTKEIEESVALEYVNREAWRAQNDKNYSFITELVQNQVEISIEGSESRYEHLWDISLPIDTCSSIQAALTKYVEAETIHDYKRGEHTLDVRCTRKFVYTPVIMIIHLKRFNNKNKKIDKFVDYATELTISAGAAYALFAVIMHSGTLHNGHYTCCCEVKGHWFKMDDQVVTPIVDINAIIQRDAYMLFYKRIM